MIVAQRLHVRDVVVVVEKHNQSLAEHSGKVLPSTNGPCFERSVHYCAPAPLQARSSSSLHLPEFAAEPVAVVVAAAVVAVEATFAVGRTRLAGLV